MRKFQCHNIIQAEQIIGFEIKTTPTTDYVEFILENGETVISSFDVVYRNQPQKGDYLIKRHNDYLSVCPKHVFEQSYTEVKNGINA